MFLIPTFDKEPINFHLNANTCISFTLFIARHNFPLEKIADLWFNKLVKTNQEGGMLMMINKRLIATVAESQKYIAGNVVSQWVSLCSNVVIMGSIATFVGKLAYAKPQANDHDFIMSLPDGYDTVIGEGGASISDGEKQRISIARAIMKNAPIIILDEATANVDPENEKELVEAIDALTKEKTIIMIAHRLKTVRNADQIVVVDSGKIAQLGTHTQLMQEGGIYKNFVNARQQAACWKINA